MKMSEGKSWRDRRKVYVASRHYTESDSPLRMFASVQPGHIIVAGGRPAFGWNRLWVPAEAIAAFEAGADPLPMIDYLLERNPDLDWLHAAVRAAQEAL